MIPPPAMSNSSKKTEGEYSFEKFTEDSSDDSPKYADGITPNLDEVKSKEVVDYPQKPKEKEVNKLIIGLHNVLELAKENIERLYGENNVANADETIARESIEIVEDFLSNEVQKLIPPQDKCPH